MVSRKCGKLPARHDHRIASLHQHQAALPPPPDSANWYANVPAWGMLANDQVGDCVEAAVMHQIYQNLCYTRPGEALAPTDVDTLGLYSAVTGYVPGNESTDQGTYVLGPGGMMEYWHTHGVSYGGRVDQVSAYLQVSTTRPVEWRQSISLFGSLLTGILVPTSIAESSVVPPVWSDASGDIAGGHEILLVGYETSPDGVLYDLVSWGNLYRATEAFLLAACDEMVVAYDPDFVNASGVNAVGVNEATLLADMLALRSV